MSRRRFFIDPQSLRGGFAVLPEDEAHHVREVLRLRAGDEIELFDGWGLSYSGKIASLGPEITVGPLKRIEPAAGSRLSIVLAAALIRPHRFEWILQKGTELGVERFLPLETRCTAVRISGTKVSSRLDRWRRIVREASKQSRRPDIPEVDAPIAAASLWDSSEHADRCRILLHERASERIDPVAIPSDRILLCTGPEGGWDDREVKAAQEAGYKIVNLGSRVLRSETAAIAAVAVLQFAAGES
jgi:16S rRNA (uracil1498-N3)-methyltransferase